MWTQFWDMHSGGGQKLDWARIYIEADQQEAISVFYSRFGRNPDRVTCTCCGPDYSISTSETLEQVSGYHRNCKTKDNKYIEEVADDFRSRKGYMTVEQYSALPEVKIIRASEIKDDERKHDVPEEGYVWQ